MTASTSTVTAEQIVKAVRELAGEKPDYVYNNDAAGCVYVHQGQPSCILGHALWRLGVIDGEFEEGTLNEVNFSQLVDALELPAFGADFQWLCFVQDQQDSAVPWADAVAHADGQD